MLKKDLVLIITVVSDKKKVNYLQFKEVAFDEMGVEVDESKKMGFKELKEGINPKKALEAAQEYEWYLDDTPDERGNYAVHKGDKKKKDVEVTTEEKA